MNILILMNKKKNIIQNIKCDNKEYSFTLITSYALNCNHKI